MKAISGLKTIVSNVNLPNAGQAAFMPIDGIVETNCVFTKGSARPMNASVSSPALAGLLQRACQNIDALWEGIKARDIKAIYAAFVAEPLCANLTLHDSKSLFIEMVNNTRECLEPYYDLSKLDDILNSIPYGI
jgi:alpha-galactosidase